KQALSWAATSISSPTSLRAKSLSCLFSCTEASSCRSCRQNLNSESESLPPGTRGCLSSSANGIRSLCPSAPETVTAQGTCAGTIARSFGFFVFMPVSSLYSATFHFLEGKRGDGG